MVMTWLPYFAFIMYLINRGTGFTQALFMNCDHSLLTYSFYKRPGFVLRLFRIRLREIIKVNAVPALVIGCGLALILYVSGGTANPLDYVVLVVTILAMSAFFSIHYLTVYYLLQPYTAGTELKSGTYRIVMVLTYVVRGSGAGWRSSPAFLSIIPSGDLSQSPCKTPDTRPPHSGIRPQDPLRFRIGTPPYR